MPNQTIKLIARDMFALKQALDNVQNSIGTAKHLVFENDIVHVEYLDVARGEITITIKGQDNAQ